MQLADDYVRIIRPGTYFALLDAALVQWMVARYAIALRSTVWQLRGCTNVPVNRSPIWDIDHIEWCRKAIRGIVHPFVKPAPFMSGEPWKLYSAWDFPQEAYDALDCFSNSFAVGDRACFLKGKLGSGYVPSYTWIAEVDGERYRVCVFANRDSTFVWYNAGFRVVHWQNIKRAVVIIAIAPGRLVLQHVGSQSEWHMKFPELPV